MNKPPFPPSQEKLSNELRERITKLRARLPKGDPKAAFVGIVLGALPAVYDAALAGDLPQTLRAGARLIYSMGLAKLASPEQKTQASESLSAPP